MWKPEHRQAAECRSQRYPSDLTDAEWALVEPMIPPAKRGGRPRDVNLREVLNAILYVLATGCQWQALPKCGFRGKAASDSDGRRPPNPIQSGHRFRSKAATLLKG